MLSSLNHETEPRPVTVVAGIDVDRCTIDSDALVAELMSSLSRILPGRDDEIQAETRRILAGTGNELDYLPELMAAFDLPFDAEAAKAVLFEPRSDGQSPEERREELHKPILASGFIDSIEEFDKRYEEVAYFLMTRGGAQTQKFKVLVIHELIAPHKPIPALIITSDAKSQFASDEWWSDGQFKVRFKGLIGTEERDIAVGIAKTFVMIDDRKTNLHSNNAGNRGVLIDNKGNTTESQRTFAEFAAQLRAGMSMLEVSSIY